MVATNTFMVVFRVVHVLAGVIWVGAVFLFVVFVQPSAATVGPAAGVFVAELLGRRRMVDFIIATASTSVLGGLVLYWRDMQEAGGLGDWLGSTFGLTLTVGAIAALAALTIGLTVTRPNVMRMLALGREAAASGGPPDADVAARIATIQRRLRLAARISLALLILSVVTMAVARYL